MAATPISTTKTGFTGAEIQDFTALHLLTRRPEHTPARSVALITEETPEASLLAVSRVSEAVPMALTPAGAASTVAVVFTVVAALMAAVEGIGDRIYTHLEFVKIQDWRKCNAT